MPLFNKKPKVRPELEQEITQLCEQHNEILLVSLCTTDGFSIKAVAAKSLKAEADRLAAMSSTIAALSDSSAKQVMKDDFTLTIVETASGNLLFISTEYMGTPCVLTIAAKANMPLATVRFNTKRLSDKIKQMA